jgi:hypothetical protein
MSFHAPGVYTGGPVMTVSDFGLCKSSSLVKLDATSELEVRLCFTRLISLIARQGHALGCWRNQR